jgi:PAS domain S-box-containing protein
MPTLKKQSTSNPIVQKVVKQLNKRNGPLKNKELNKLSAEIERIGKNLKSANTTIDDYEERIRFLYDVMFEYSAVHFSKKMKKKGGGIDDLSAGIYSMLKELGIYINQLKESEDRARNLFEYMPYPAWVYDVKTLRFLEVNSIAIKNYGYTRDEFLAMTLKDIRPKEELPRLADDLKRRGNTDFATSRGWKHKLCTGELIDVEITSHLFNFRGKEAALVIAQDITQRIKTEQLVIQKNKDITDSIKYANMIQTAMLAPVYEINKALGEYFILFKPKDIVSGDFYYVHYTEPDEVVIAAIDCTGHGVPGAFVSMVGNDVLNQLVVEKKINKPADILSGMHDGVRFALRQNEGDSQSFDGMDMALCVFNKKERVLHFSGALRNLYLFKKDGAYVEVKCDKQSIGGVNSGIRKTFTNHTIQLDEGDTFYMFTDGYTDQFGGEMGKKFTTKRFTDFLSTLQIFPLKEQKKQLNELFEAWKGFNDQIDDVLVIGVRV